MTVRCIGETIFLEAECPAEDGAALAQQLGLHRHAIVVWSECESMHTAVFQVLLAARPRLRGTPAGDFLRTYLAPLLAPPRG
jgi:hypothetical protein